jgi:glycosyltransferase involved in cell wall biosynthesis
VRIIVVTQQVDPEHPALAATIAKLRALAARVDELDVMALGGSASALPQNCRLELFGGRAKLLRGLRFWRVLRGELRREPRCDLVLAHMCPIYAILAAPFTRRRGVPLALWYTHWKRTPTLRLAGRLVDHIVSVDERSVPLRSPKVRAIGHGIDPSEFPCHEPPSREAGVLRVLVLGRYSRAKGIETILRATQIALSSDLDLVVDIHGPALTRAEIEHKEYLNVLREELGLGDRVLIGEALSRTQVPALLADHDLLVNNMEAGALDKVVFEAAASCTPVIASNPGFDALLPAELRFRRSQADELAERLIAFSRLDLDRRRTLGRLLRERVCESHSVDSWAEGIIGLTQ